jgi:N-acetylmuramoyl-L-alanine amidase
MAFRFPKRAALAAAVALAFASPFGEARAETAPPAAIAAHSEVQGRETRLSFTLQSCVKTEAYLLGGPARAVIDLPEVNFRIDPAAGAPPTKIIASVPEKGRHSHAPAPPTAGLIALFRFGRLAPGKSRIVADLAGPAEIVSAGCAPIPGAAELTLVLAPATDSAFKAATRAGARRQALADAPPPDPPAPPPSDKPVIVIDPGHGGVDSGALGRHHAIEKFIVLDFAKALGARLDASGHYRVVYTRDDDRYISLGERTRIARRLNAALFVSVHADSLRSAGDDVSGATIYTVSDRASDVEAARIAEHENMADSSAGEEAKQDAGDVNDILLDLTRRETRAFSGVFARSLAEYFKVAARLNKNPRRSAGFVVLKSPDVPSVLLELGYLSNARDVADLNSPDWRDKAATQVARAIDNFFAGQRPPAAATALKATQSVGN